MRYKAFIFDLNGTIIDDMKFHADAWFHILNNELDAHMSRDQVDKEMYGKNDEVLDRIFGPTRFSPDEKIALSIQKEQQYQKAFHPHLKLIPGLGNFLKETSDHSVKMAIGTAAIKINVDFILDNLHIRKYFPVVVNADDVKKSKPDPETFLKCATLLNVRPQDCLVFEDVPKGAEAARNAGMDAVIITTGHVPTDFTNLDNVRFFVSDYTAPPLTGLWK